MCSCVLPACLTADLLHPSKPGSFFQSCLMALSARLATAGTALQDVCGNQVEAQERHHEGLRLSVTGALKENGEPSQLQELQLDAQVTFTLPTGVLT